MGRTGKVAKEYGAQTQRWVADWYKRLWPAATTTGAGTPGRDVLNVPVSIEVKGRADFAPMEWVREARRRHRTPATLEALKTRELDVLPPHVVVRPIGLGEGAIGEFLVIRSLEDDTAILAELLSLRELAASDLVVEARHGQAPR